MAASKTGSGGPDREKDPGFVAVELSRSNMGFPFRLVDEGRRYPQRPQPLTETAEGPLKRSAGQARDRAERGGCGRLWVTFSTKCSNEVGGPADQCRDGAQECRGLP